MEAGPIQQKARESSDASLPLLFPGIFFASFTPELVPGAMDEHIFERRLADRNRLNPARESFDEIWDEAVSFLTLDAHLIAEHRGRDMETRANVLGKQARVV